MFIQAETYDGPVGLTGVVENSKARIGGNDGTSTRSTPAPFTDKCCPGPEELPDGSKFERSADQRTVMFK